MDKKIVIVAGGTGGHIFPGLAVAKQLQTMGYTVNWIGCSAGMESKLVLKHNIPIDYINIHGIRGKNFFSKLLSPFYIIIAILQSLKLLIKLQPNLVLGMGGFVTGPAGIAAWLLGKKLIIHEQNVVVGTTNRILSIFAQKILISFQDSIDVKSKFIHKVVLTGNPIRADFDLLKPKLLIDDSKDTFNILPNIQTYDSENLCNILIDNSKNSHNNLFKLSVDDSKDKFNILSKTAIDNSEDQFNILVLGGSKGARFLNEIVPKALTNLAGIKILHQTGEQDYASTVAAYRDNIVAPYKLQAFIEDMPAAYANADLVICRAGAATIFELMATGSASIMIPLPWAIDDHQSKNAEYLVKHGAGIALTQVNLSAEQLRIEILKFKDNYANLLKIKQAAYSLYQEYKINNSAKRVAEIIDLLT